MNAAASKLVRNVIRWQALFSLGTAALLAWPAPHLLLVNPAIVFGMTSTLALAVAAAGATSAAMTWFKMRRFRYVLRALTVGSSSVEPEEMADLGEEPARVTRHWFVPHSLAVLVLATPWRPATMDVTTGLSVALLGAVIVAAASLPLHVLVRSAILRAVELAPEDVMLEVAVSAKERGQAKSRIVRRLLTSVATPVAFVAIGSALIANAHLRRADEYSREETARAIARASLEQGPGLVEGAGLAEATEQAEHLGFSPSLGAGDSEYSIERRQDGLTVLNTPLDSGSAEVRFSGSTVPLLSAQMLLIALLAVSVAGALGYGLGRAYTTDLEHATKGLQLVGTERVISGSSLLTHPARFHVVAELQEAIEALAGRFRVFAQAQERAIDAREAATRTRGLFFASVSHDLKSPLNAILGFVELLRFDPLTRGQAESLDVIEQRGRELLALIETILDAARVEARQLSLVVDGVKLSDLYGEAVAKARDLGADRNIDVIGEFGEGVGLLAVDRTRAARALATFIAYAVRHAVGEAIRVRARRGEGGATVVLEIGIPSRRLTARQVRRLLELRGDPRLREHRGLALALKLSRSVVELHGGSVEVASRRGAGPELRIALPRAED